MKELEELGKHFLGVALAFLIVGVITPLAQGKANVSGVIINQGEQEKMNNEFLTYYIVLGGLVALTGIGFILWAKLQGKRTTDHRL